ncbi:hypothetical protein AB4Z52_29490 [Rhizobium sp. 2YAF20]|uniref:hypothetical protein n=1 Tax=Rhizobium sp. 2YAF20 TaxID=3233027 RepID=UPI003F95EE57
MVEIEADFAELLARRRTARLAQLAKGQPEEFWETLGAKLDNSSDDTITMDDFMEALHQGDCNE